VHPKFDTGAAENCTLATPVIEYKIFKICYAELPNILCFSRYLIIKIFGNIPSWFNCHKDRELLQYVAPLPGTSSRHPRAVFLNLFSFAEPLKHF